MGERSYFFYDEIDSTMAEYKRLQEFTEGLLCVCADTQKDGIGRIGKKWLSPKGGLWFTFDLIHHDVIPSFALFVGYCIHKELTNLFAPLEDKLEIKWTNDIMFDGNKLGGILCKHYPGRYIIGIGINTNNDIDSEVGKFGSICLKNILETNISNQHLCRNLIAAIESRQKQLLHSISYITYCNEHLFGRNQLATIDVGTEPFKAEILGIDLQGALIIRKPMGEIINIHSGSVIDVKPLK
nr:BirA family transcriptional regulator [Candidatus Cloacimonadota bacterium]